MRTLSAPRELASRSGLSSIEIRIERIPMVLKDETWPLADTPDRIATAIQHYCAGCGLDYETERMFVVLLSTRRRILSIQEVSTGTLDTLLVHPREIFRAAIVANASAIVLSHLHPSGDPAPSEGDVRVTRELFRAGQLLKIELLDHVVVANPTLLQPGARGWSSLRELGYFYN